MLLNAPSSSDWELNLDGTFMEFDVIDAPAGADGFIMAGNVNAEPLLQPVSAAFAVPASQDFGPELSPGDTGVGRIAWAKGATQVSPFSATKTVHLT